MRSCAPRHLFAYKYLVRGGVMIAHSLHHVFHTRSHTLLFAQYRKFTCQGAIFKEFFVAGKDFLKMRTQTSIIKSSESRSDLLEGYKTKSQLLLLFGPGSEDMVEDLVRRKRATGAYRRHPDMPDREDGCSKCDPA